MTRDEGLEGAWRAAKGRNKVIDPAAGSRGREQHTAAAVAGTARCVSLGSVCKGLTSL